MKRIISLFLSLSISTIASADSDNLGKITKLLERNKLEKAVTLCDKAFSATPAPTEQALREVCARADLEYASVPHANTDVHSELDRIAGKWPNTDAGRKAREKAASVELLAVGQLPAESGERRSKLESLVALYEGTEGAKSAAGQLRGIDLEAAKKAGTVEALTDFRARFPGTTEAAEAGRLEFDMAYQQALAKDSVDGWQKLLQTYPDHPRLAEVKARVGDSELRAANAGGPEEQLAFADRYPNDARSAGLRTQAAQKLASVVLFGREGWALQQSTEPSTTVRPDVTTVYVSQPGAMEPIKAELVMIQSGRRLPFEAGFAARLEQRGMSHEQATRNAQVHWESVGKELLVGSLAQPLCQGSDPRTWWAVVTHVGGGEQILPFRVARLCLDTKAVRNDALTSGTRGVTGEGAQTLRGGAVDEPAPTWAMMPGQVTRDDLLAAASAACEGPAIWGQSDDKKREVVRCSRCPKLSLSNESQADPGPPTYPYEAALSVGSFTEPGAFEAVVDLPCEPHAGNYGDTVLVRKTQSGWQSVGFAGAERTNQCHTIHSRDGRDLLLCEAGYMFQGNGSQWLSALRFNGADFTEEPLATVNFDGSFLSCGESFGGSMSWNQADIDGDRTPDVVINISATRSMTRKAKDGSCEDIRGSSLEKQYRFKMLFDGQEFRLSPESRNGAADMNLRFKKAAAIGPGKKTRHPLRMTLPDFGTVTPDGSISLTIESLGSSNTLSKGAFIVAHGEKIILTLRNNASESRAKFNWVLVKKGFVDQVGSAGFKAGEARGYIPHDSNVLAHTTLAAPGKTVSVTFDAPSPGEYEFLCSSSNVWSGTRGTFTVR